MTDNLKFPTSTPETANMLGFFKDAHNGNYKSIPVSSLPIANLPVSEEPKESHKPIEEKNHQHRGADNLMLDENLPKSKGTKLKKVFRSLFPLLLVFIAGLTIYYFFLSKKGFTFPNFGTFFQSTKNSITPKENALMQLQNQGLANYYAWISQFYFDVSDSKITDPNADNSGNGLTNFQKFLLNLNPKSYDTIGLGVADSQAIAQGVNPLTGGSLSEDQKNIVEKYFDMEIISNRLALANLQRAQNNVAGAADYADKDVSWFRQIFGLQNQNGLNQNLNFEELDINTNIPGRLEIPSLGINVPLMWSKNTKDFENDLRSGVVHYPGTAMPGEIGTTYISGHSSNYAWAKGDFNKVFSKLNNLANNESFKITVVQNSGKNAILHYVVTERKEFSATDQEQFKNSGDSVAALSTCWPVNTTAKRLVVFGKLTQIEK
jgi:LPXTG-site transpeptidase (sortase) family protein